MSVSSMRATLSEPPFMIIKSSSTLSRAGADDAGYTSEQEVGQVHPYRDGKQGIQCKTKVPRCKDHSLMKITDGSNRGVRALICLRCQRSRNNIASSRMFRCRVQLVRAIHMTPFRQPVLISGRPDATPYLAVLKGGRINESAQKKELSMIARECDDLYVWACQTGCKYSVFGLTRIIPMFYTWVSLVDSDPLSSLLINLANQRHVRRFIKSEDKLVSAQRFGLGLGFESPLKFNGINAISLYLPWVSVPTRMSSSLRTVSRYNFIIMEFLTFPVIFRVRQELCCDSSYLS